MPEVVKYCFIIYIIIDLMCMFEKQCFHFIAKKYEVLAPNLLNHLLVSIQPMLQLFAFIGLATCVISNTLVPQHINASMTCLFAVQFTSCICMIIIAYGNLDE